MCVNSAHARTGCRAVLSNTLSMNEDNQPNDIRDTAKSPSPHDPETTTSTMFPNVHDKSTTTSRMLPSVHDESTTTSRMLPSVHDESTTTSRMFPDVHGEPTSCVLPNVQIFCIVCDRFSQIEMFHFVVWLHT